MRCFMRKNIKEKFSEIFMLLVLTFITMPCKVFADNTTTSNETVSNLKCDTDIIDLIHKYWKWVVFIVPLALIVTITIDFIKAMTSGDADAIKKSVNNMVKRVVAALILIALPWALSVIFGWFGLQICF